MLIVSVFFFFLVLTVNVSHKQFTLEELPAEKYHSSSLLNISHSELESLCCVSSCLAVVLVVGCRVVAEGCSCCLSSDRTCGAGFLLKPDTKRGRFTPSGSALTVEICHRKK